MATLVLPTTGGVNAFAFEAELEGTLYGFELVWNVRDSAWYLTIRDADGSDIVSGRRVVADFPLLRGVTDTRRPLGEIVALDLDGAGDPGKEDFGARVALLYLESTGA